MLKVALINPPQSTPYSQPPMGLAIIAAVLEREGYQVTVVDAHALKLRLAEIVPSVSGADVAGLTAMTPTIGAAIDIARQLKRSYPHLTIILGGAHATLLPEETLGGAPEVDIIVRGEGETTIVELLKALESKQPVENVPGISYRRNGTVINNEMRNENTDLDSLPFLAFHLLPWRRYKPHPPHGRAFPFGAIITSRGCPYKCSYCSKPIFGNKFRAQSPERVVAEIAYYQENFGIRELAFYDDVFTLNKERAYAICDSIIQKGLKICWTCETRVNLVEKRLLLRMKQAGCYAIAYGIESASPEILDAIHKGITLDEVEEAVRISQEVGLQVIGYFMLGNVNETPETVRRTIAFAKKLKLDFAQFAITTPFPGTELYQLYQKERGGSIPWANFVYGETGNRITPVFDNAQLSRTDLQYWLRQAHREFYLRPSYVWQRIRRVRSFGDLKTNINGFFMLLRTIKPSAKGGA